MRFRLSGPAFFGRLTETVHSGRLQSLGTNQRYHKANILTARQYTYSRRNFSSKLNIQGPQVVYVFRREFLTKPSAEILKLRRRDAVVNQAAVGCT